MGAVDRCSFTSLTALFSAAMQMSFEARSAAARGEVVLALQSQTRLENLLPAMKAIAAYSPSVEAIVSVFQKLSMEVKEQTKLYFSTLELIQDESATNSGVDINSSSETVPGSASWNPNFNNNFAAGWRNIFGVGDINAFDNFEALGPMESWLTMSSTDNNSFSR